MIAAIHCDFEMTLYHSHSPTLSLRRAHVECFIRCAPQTLPLPHANTRVRSQHKHLHAARRTRRADVAQ